MSSLVNIKYMIFELFSAFSPLSRWSWLYLSDSSQLLHSKQVRWKCMSSMCTWRNGCYEDTHATDLWNTGNAYYKLRIGFLILRLYELLFMPFIAVSTCFVHITQLYYFLLFFSCRAQYAMMLWWPVAVEYLKHVEWPEKSVSGMERPSYCL